ncbi:glycine receptor subunit alpha-2-like [Hydractinia symbiolongicarpus]|uniref:glycine receptor subunit alpha-2-like n=1 Tax=Hydractinia symbiolongicarpus TaxID=13093 RepID=UPI00254B3189|nr:glycine receptor subunit alpha-2-like [Hydractinia symbiolongicarpus]XP_057311181.1 glycine receptor subunit alpha-2-like [Hydractinia symbiolongicarpus]
MHLLLTAICFSFGLIQHSVAQNFHVIDTKIAAGTYDKRIRPRLHEDTVRVTTQIYLLYLGPVNEKTFTYEMGYYHRSWWNDPRLEFNTSIGSITYTKPPADFIWIPDGAVTNAKKIERFDTSVRTVISPNGDVYVSQRMKAICSCPMDLKEFPMDTQKCPFRMESFSYKSKDMELLWHETPIIKENADLEGYVLENIEFTSSLKSYFINNVTENYNNLLLTFVVHRTFAFYFYRMYAPTVVLMVFNFGSFWIPPSAVPARVALIVTTLLINVVILQSVTEQIVKVEYVTAMQLFLLINILFVLLAVVEYLVVLALEIRKTQTQQKSTEEESKKSGIVNKTFKPNVENGNTINVQPIQEKKIPKNLESGRFNAQNIDRWSRLIHPLLYCVFCAVYFGYYKR